MMQKTVYRLLLGFALPFALLAGCAKEEYPDTGEFLSFEAVQEGETRRGASVDQPDTPDYLIAPGRQISVYGTITRTGMEDYEVFSGQTVTCGEDLDWTYSPLKYWKRSGVYDFKAVFPRTASILSGTSGKRLLVRHSVVASHMDLMVASAQRNPATQGTAPVELKFRHACSAVRFLFKKESAADDYKLTAFKLQNLRVLGSLDVSGDEVTLGSWHTSGNAPVSEVFAWTAAAASDRKEIPVTYALYTDAQWYYMIPQTMAVPAGTARPSVTFSVIFNGEPTSVTTTLPLPDTYEEDGQTLEAQWEPGKVYTYYINLKPSRVAITVHVTPWDEQDLSVDGEITFD